MHRLQISLFGRFRVQWEGHELDGLASGKAGEIFCFLLMHRRRSHSREFLAELMWPDYSNTQSRKYLRQALWQLQSAWNAYRLFGDQQILIVDQSFVSINCDVDFWLDVDAFERIFLAFQDKRGHELSDENARLLKEAVHLYHTDLLDGSYQDWCVSERERLRSSYLMMLDKLMEYCEAHQEYETGITYGYRILCYERAHERTHRRLMRMYYLSGDRTAALRQYQLCVLSMDRELGVRPTQSTTALYEQIVNGRLDALPLRDIEPRSVLSDSKLPPVTNSSTQVANAS